ncbi:MAG: HEAT repeat domain-containing protein [Elusimicrobiota bacterium]
MIEPLRLAILAAIEGRPSMGVVILASIALFFLVLAMAVYLIFLRAWHRLRHDYRRSRAVLYEPAVEMVLMDEPYEKIREALRPRRRGDADIVQEVVTQAMRHLQGPPFETFRRVSLELGFLRDNLEALKSWDRHRRGHAMERLGFLRSSQAVDPLVALMDRESLEMKLVAMRALAAIGDPRALPPLVAAALQVPPGLLPRLTSMILEFGPPGREAVLELINRRPGAFPTSATRDLLRELAQDWGAS